MFLVLQLDLRGILICDWSLELYSAECLLAQGHRGSFCCAARIGMAGDTSLNVHRRRIRGHSLTACLPRWCEIVTFSSPCLSSTPTAIFTLCGLSNFVALDTR